MKAGHTPGPWSVNLNVRQLSTHDRVEVLVHVGEGESQGNAIAIVGMGGPGAIYSAEAGVVANARLIAAAPTMYVFVQLCADSGDKQAIQILENINASS